MGSSPRSTSIDAQSEHRVTLKDDSSRACALEQARYRPACSLLALGSPQRRSMRKVSIASRSRMTGHALVRLSRPDTGLLVACWLSEAPMHSLQKSVVWGVYRTVYVS